jgi:hypothetical protein
MWMGNEKLQPGTLGVDMNLKLNWNLKYDVGFAYKVCID